VSQLQDLLQEYEDLSPRERAAALAHHVYVLTSRRVGWQQRVPPGWRELSDDARAFNLASIDTWVEEREVRAAWAQLLDDLDAGGD
jgi:hypothetical protein